MEKKTSNKAWFLVIPALIMVLIAAALPMAAVVNYSVQDVFAGDRFVWVGTRWFQEVLRSPDFQASLFRSLAFSAIVLCIEVPLGLFVATRMPDKGMMSNIYIVLMAIPLLTPWLVVGFVWKVLVDVDAGLLGATFAGLGLNYDLDNVFVAWATIVLMDVWHWTSLIALLCYAGLQSIPFAYYQAAEVDGASGWAVFRYIQIPKIKHVLLIAVLLRFMDSFMIYTEPFLLTRGGPAKSTTFLSLDLVQTASIQFDLGEAGAMSIIYFLIILLVCWSLFNIMMRRNG
ncbi:MAG: sugar ABC transporter permease [Marinosulfonomonas sp.]|nr:sugar ABC transporter permease [Marinosulfonomonas sp.]